MECQTLSVVFNGDICKIKKRGSLLTNLRFCYILELKYSKIWGVKLRRDVIISQLITWH